MGEQLTLEGMPAPPRRAPGPIERAWRDGDDERTVEEVVAKCARMLDECSSGRDVKALSVTVLDGVALRRQMRGGEETGEDDPLNGIVLKFGAARVAAS